MEAGGLEGSGQGSRLSALVQLLRDAESANVRSAAVRAIGDVAAQLPEQIGGVLRQITPLLYEDKWETRVAAAQTLGAIVAHLPLLLWTASSGSCTSDRIPTRPDRCPINFDSVNVEHVAKHAAPLVASEGEEFEVPASKMWSLHDLSRRTKRERKRFLQRLAVDLDDQMTRRAHFLADIDRIVKEEDVVTTAASAKSSAGKNNQIPVKRLLQHTSYREGKYEESQSDVSRALKNDKLPAHRENLEQSTSQRTSPTPVPIKGVQKGRETDAKQTPSLAKDGEGDTPGHDLSNTFSLLFHVLFTSLVDARWQRRHGAAAALQSILSAILSQLRGGSALGAGFGVRSKVQDRLTKRKKAEGLTGRRDDLQTSGDDSEHLSPADEHQNQHSLAPKTQKPFLSTINRPGVTRTATYMMKKNSLSTVLETIPQASVVEPAPESPIYRNSETNVGLEVWLEELLLRLLVTLLLDRFDDFSGERGVVAPVREKTAQCVALLLLVIEATAPSLATSLSISNMVRTLFRSSNAWQTRHGLILVVNYIGLAKVSIQKQKRREEGPPVFAGFSLLDLLGFIEEALADPMEDVQMVAASCVKTAAEGWVITPHSGTLSFKNSDKTLEEQKQRILWKLWTIVETNDVTKEASISALAALSVLLPYSGSLTPSERGSNISQVFVPKHSTPDSTTTQICVNSARDWVSWILPFIRHPRRVVRRTALKTANTLASEGGFPPSDTMFHSLFRVLFSAAVCDGDEDIRKQAYEVVILLICQVEPGRLNESLQCILPYYLSILSIPDDLRVEIHSEVGTGSQSNSHRLCNTKCCGRNEDEGRRMVGPVWSCDTHGGKRATRVIRSTKHVSEFVLPEQRLCGSKILAHILSRLESYHSGHRLVVTKLMEMMQSGFSGAQQASLMTYTCWRQRVKACHAVPSDSEVLGVHAKREREEAEDDLTARKRVVEHFEEHPTEFDRAHGAAHTADQADGRLRMEQAVGDPASCPTLAKLENVIADMLATHENSSLGQSSTLRNEKMPSGAKSMTPCVNEYSSSAPSSLRSSCASDSIGSAAREILAVIGGFSVLLRPLRTLVRLFDNFFDAFSVSNDGEEVENISVFNEMKTKVVEMETFTALMHDDLGASEASSEKAAAAVDKQAKYVLLHFPTMLTVVSSLPLTALWEYSPGQGEVALEKQAELMELQGKLGYIKRKRERRVQGLAAAALVHDRLAIVKLQVHSNTLPETAGVVLRPLIELVKQEGKKVWGLRLSQEGSEVCPGLSCAERQTQLQQLHSASSVSSNDLRETKQRKNVNPAIEMPQNDFEEGLVDIAALSIFNYCLRCPPNKKNSRRKLLQNICNFATAGTRMVLDYSMQRFQDSAADSDDTSGMQKGHERETVSRSIDEETSEEDIDDENFDERKIRDSMQISGQSLEALYVLRGGARRALVRIAEHISEGVLENFGDFLAVLRPSLAEDSTEDLALGVPDHSRRAATAAVGTSEDMREYQDVAKLLEACNLCLLVWPCLPENVQTVLIKYFFTVFPRLLCFPSALGGHLCASLVSSFVFSHEEWCLQLVKQLFSAVGTYDNGKGTGKHPKMALSLMVRKIVARLDERSLRHLDFLLEFVMRGMTDYERKVRQYSYETFSMLVALVPLYRISRETGSTNSGDEVITAGNASEAGEHASQRTKQELTIETVRDGERDSNSILQRDSAQHPRVTLKDSEIRDDIQDPRSLFGQQTARQAELKQESFLERLLGGVTPTMVADTKRTLTEIFASIEKSSLRLQRNRQAFDTYLAASGGAAGSQGYRQEEARMHSLGASVRAKQGSNRPSGLRDAKEELGVQQLKDAPEDHAKSHNSNELQQIEQSSLQNLQSTNAPLQYTECASPSDKQGQVSSTASVEMEVGPRQEEFREWLQAEFVPSPGILRHYQLEGISWLLFLQRHGLHGALCDDLGLGKTLQLLSVLAVVKWEQSTEIQDEHKEAVNGLVKEKESPLMTGKRLSGNTVGKRKLSNGGGAQNVECEWLEDGGEEDDGGIERRKGQEYKGIETEEGTGGDNDRRKENEGHTRMNLGAVKKVGALSSGRRSPLRHSGGNVSLQRSSAIHLIVCPSTIVDHWQAEAQRFFQGFLRLRTYVGSPARRAELLTCLTDVDALVVSYSLLRRDFLRLGEFDWQYVVLDEAQAIKNSRSEVAKCVRGLRSKHRVVLTGTPVQNSVAELFSLFEFLMPGYLGPRSLFRMNIEKPIEKDRASLVYVSAACDKARDKKELSGDTINVKSSERQVALSSDKIQRKVGKQKATKTDSSVSLHEWEAESSANDSASSEAAQALNLLHRKVLPFLLRRTKDQVLRELPPRILQDVCCDMSSSQASLYKFVLANSASFSPLQFLHLLRLAAVHPKLLPPALIENRLKEQSKRFEGQRVEIQSSNSFGDGRVRKRRRMGGYMDSINVDVANNLRVREEKKKEGDCKSRVMAVSMQERERLRSLSSGKIEALRELLKDCGILEGRTSVVSAHRCLIFAQSRRALDLIEEEVLKQQPRREMTSNSTRRRRLKAQTSTGRIPEARGCDRKQDQGEKASEELSGGRNLQNKKERLAREEEDEDHGDEGKDVGGAAAVHGFRAQGQPSEWTGVSYLRIDGSTPPSSRFSVVDQFQNDPSIDVLLLTVGVGGVGLSLTAADVVIFFEHDWNPFRDLQAMDRAHRLGQTRSVQVFRLITRGTIEDDIMNLQRFKQFVSSSIVKDQNASIQNLSTSQILRLFGQTKDGTTTRKTGSRARSTAIGEIKEDNSSDHSALALRTSQQPDKAMRRGRKAQKRKPEAHNEDTDVPGDVSLPSALAELSQTLTTDEEYEELLRFEF